MQVCSQTLLVMSVSSLHVWRERLEMDPMKRDAEDLNFDLNFELNYHANTVKYIFFLLHYL